MSSTSRMSQQSSRKIIQTQSRTVAVFRRVVCFLVPVLPFSTTLSFPLDASPTPCEPPSTISNPRCFHPRLRCDPTPTSLPSTHHSPSAFVRARSSNAVNVPRTTGIEKRWGFVRFFQLISDPSSVRSLRSATCLPLTPFQYNTCHWKSNLGHRFEISVTRG